MYNTKSVFLTKINHLALCALMAVSLAACGGDDAAGTAAAQTSSTGTTAATTSAAVQPFLLHGVPLATVEAGSVYEYTPSATGSNGRVLTYDIVNKPEWATFIESTGQLSGTPDGTNVGTSGEIEIGVSDGSTRATVGPFRIRVIPQEQRTDPVTPTPPAAPTITGTPASNDIAGQLYSFTPIVTNPASAVLSFSIVNRPAWAAFNTATGSLTGTPTTANVGAFANIVISVSSAAAPISLPAFSIQVQPAADNAPTISGTPATKIAGGADYSFKPVAGDPDGNALTFSILNAPSWANLNTHTGQLSGTAPSSTTASLFSNIVISVSDGTLSASLPSFSIAVQATSGSGGGGSTGGGKIKFHPGYYIELDPNSSLASQLSIIDSLKGAQNLVGVSIIEPWSMFEPSRGVYTGGAGSGVGFDLVDQLISHCASSGLRLIIGMQAKTFGTYRAGGGSYGVFPSYWETTPDSTGAAPLYLSATSNDNSGTELVTAKFYDSVPIGFYKQLLAAYGARYDSNPTFEMWRDSTETANGLYDQYFNGSNTPFDEEVQQFIGLAAAMRASFPTSGLSFSTNFMNTSAEFNTLFNGCIPYGIGVGGPDVKTNLPAGSAPSYSNDYQSTDTIVFNGFIGGTDYRNVLPFVGENQDEDIPSVYGPSYLSTLYTEMFQGALGSGGSIQPNYWIIQYFQPGAGWSSSSVASWIASAGSLNTTRPSSY
jgi:Putative Ig domain